MEAIFEPLKQSCYRPFEMLVFTADGRTSGCSNDLYLENNLGNVNEQHVADIFSGRQINLLRKQLLEGDRTSFEACKKCDYYGMTKHYNYKSAYKPLMYLYE